MSAGFTPGPWAMNPFVARVDCQKISNKGGLLPVCQMLWPTDERTEQETEANCHLIAAAPALYEALDALMSKENQDLVPLFEKAEAALKQARGDLVDPLEQVKL